MTEPAAVEVDGLEVDRGGTPVLGAGMAIDIAVIAAATLAALGLGALTLRRRSA